MSRHISGPIAVVLLGLAAAPASAQSLYGLAGSTTDVLEFTHSPGAPCGQPVPVLAPCDYDVPVCLFLNPPGRIPPPPVEFGAMCVDSLADTFFVTDGFVIQEYAARGPCGTPASCTPVRGFPAPTFLGPITGMALDESGSLFGVGRELWLTDGVSLGLVTPPVAMCNFSSPLFGPCPIPTPTFATGLTWDPVTRSLWACDLGGFITNVIVPACTPAAIFPVTGTCIPTGGSLFGITFDLGTPDLVTGLAGQLFVTDGNTIETIRVGGGVGASTFYAPVPCAASPAPLNGLACTSNAIRYGTPRVAARLTSWGQSSSPGPTFGLEIRGSPPVPAFLLLNFNVPGPGFLCPPLPGVGTLFHVDPGAGATIVALGVLPSACVPLPLPLPGAIPTGLRGFVQVIYKPAAGPAVDATNGLAFTFSAP